MKNSLYKIGDTLQVNLGGHYFIIDGIEENAAIDRTFLTHDNFLDKSNISNFCTDVLYSKRHNNYWYKFGNYLNVFTEKKILFILFTQLIV